MILDSIKDDYVVDWIGYLDTALMHNWKLNNTLLSIEFSIKEIYGEEECQKRNWQLRAEPSLQRGDLLLSSSTSSVDLFLEKRIEQLFRQFLRQNVDKTS